MPANRRKLHRLPCPVHGEFTLHPANRDAWQIVRQYGVQLLRMQRDAGFKHPLIAPDFQAIDVILRLAGCADLDTLQQVVTLLNEGVIPLMT